MPLLRVIDRNGVEHQVEAKTGLKVMETLRDLASGAPVVRAVNEIIELAEYVFI